MSSEIAGLEDDLSGFRLQVSHIVVAFTPLRPN
jgi:hypothetical protein